jgi:sarcosine oxidase
MSEPRVAVIGLGIMGSAALCQLARRGVAAIGIEQFEIGHDRGSSHGATRIIRLAHFENPSYVPLMRRAYALWRELERLAGAQLLHPTGILEIGPKDGEIVRAAETAADAYDLRPEVLDAGVLMRRYTAFRVPNTFLGVLQQDGGYIEARKAIEANIRVATNLKARILPRERVIGVEPNSTGVTVKTDRRTIKADGMIVAAGPWMRRLLPNLDLPLRVTRQVTGWFEPADAALFTAARFPVFILESEFGLHYGFPAYGGMGVKIAKHGHLDEVAEPDGYETTVSTTDETAIRAPLESYLPGANGRLLSAQTCLYTMTPDNTFIVDCVPGYPHVVIASPCCGHGFKFAPLIGEIAADLVTQGATPNDIAQFRLARFSRAHDAAGRFIDRE